jgi:hypothetical protein
VGKIVASRVRFTVFVTGGNENGVVAHYS